MVCKYNSNYPYVYIVIVIDKEILVKRKLYEFYMTNNNLYLVFDKLVYYIYNGCAVIFLKEGQV